MIIYSLQVRFNNCSHSSIANLNIFRIICTYVMAGIGLLSSKRSHTAHQREIDRHIFPRHWLGLREYFLRRWDINLRSCED